MCVRGGEGGPGREEQERRASVCEKRLRKVREARFAVEELETASLPLGRTGGPVTLEQTRRRLAASVARAAEAAKEAAQGGRLRAASIGARERAECLKGAEAALQAFRESAYSAALAPAARELVSAEVSRMAVPARDEFLPRFEWCPSRRALCMRIGDLPLERACGGHRASAGLAARLALSALICSASGSRPPPPHLFVDEALGALDPEAAKNAPKYLRSLLQSNGGPFRTVVVASHSLIPVPSEGDREARPGRGRLCFPPEKSPA